MSYFVKRGFHAFRVSTKKHRLMSGCGGRAGWLGSKLFLQFVNFLHIKGPSNFFRVDRCWPVNQLCPFCAVRSLITFLIPTL